MTVYEVMYFMFGVAVGSAIMGFVMTGIMDKVCEEEERD